MSLDLQYKWQRYGSLRKGGQLSYSLIITCKRWFLTEKVPFRLIDGTGQLPPRDGYVELAAGKSVRIDYDTYDWDWCNGDMIIIYDSQGHEAERQVFNMQTYAPGQCPECHGSHQCMTCKGTGRIIDKMHMISACPRCLGTGLCQTCYVPTRIMYSQNIPKGSSLATGINLNVEGSRQRKIEMLHQRIYDLRQKIERIEWEERMDQLHNAIHDRSIYSLYSTRMSKLQLKYQYQSMLQKAQTELFQLETHSM